MKRINQTELKKIEVSILKEIDHICRANNICYSLSYGTLLGAIRHKGFIPWDDDIDIMMPRPDYIRFIDYCKRNKNNFNLISVETASWYGYPFAKACALNTIIEEPDTDFHKKMGVYIDVFPIDGLGMSIGEAKRNYLATEFARSLVFASHWKRFFRSKTHAWYYEPVRLLFFLCSRFISRDKLIHKIEIKYQKYPFDQSKFSGCLFSQYRLRNIVKTSIFNEYIDVEFEGNKFRSVKNYNEYLKLLYGDYMKLPPKEKRVSHHIFHAFYLGK